MTQMIDKGILLIMCFCLLGRYQPGAAAVTAMLLSVIVTGILTFFSGENFSTELSRSRKRKTVLIAVYFVTALFFPELCSFLPLIFYDCGKDKFYWSVVGLGLYLRYQEGATEPLYGALWFIFSAAAILLAQRTEKGERLGRELVRVRDTGTERNLLLKEQNRNLMEKQDYEIHLATLRERNRIAREIHDNVGHMLSRSILQMGALLTVYREEPLYGQLISVNDTLNQAMTSIRESVHDLHDDAVDLRQVITEILAPMRGSYEIALEYDMSREVERNVKYCFIMAVKEAMSNVIKHSDATGIYIVLREQPAFYQLLVEDNGSVAGRKWAAESGRPGGDGRKREGYGQDVKTGGIGLDNMRERVENIGGIFRTEQQAGFKIFISVPKGKEGQVSV